MSDQPNPQTDQTHTDQERKGEPSTLQGAVPTLADEQERFAAMDQAFDYRGDVTIHTADGAVIQGYVFDRRSDADPPHVRVIPTGASDRVHINYDQITRLEFSGRDTAAGKSWETWVKKYQEKKARGEKANMMPDSLEE